MEKYLYSAKNYSLEVSDGGFSVYRCGRYLMHLLPTTVVKKVTESENENLETVFTEEEDHFETVTAFIPDTDAGVFKWEAKGKLWEKTYTLTCDDEGFSYTVTLKGCGSVGRVEYFTDTSLTGGNYASDYDFCEYFFPCPGTSVKARTTRSAAENYRSFFELLIPPCYVYSYRFEEMEGRVGLGLVARPGEYNFIHFDYTLVNGRKTGTGFSLSTDFEGHTKVNGEFTLPAIRAFFGDSDLDIVKRYSDYHYDTGLCNRHDRSKPMPRWWYGPIVCGWNEQECFMKDGASQKDLADQATYEKIADMIDEYGIRAPILIIDDMWQKGYGDCVPDPKKWPDMRAFTDKMHERGIHTLLWFRLWGGGGLPDDEVMDGEGMPYNEDRVRLDYRPYADPTNEKYRAHLKKILRILLSDEEGCMNCDGFKLDYSLVMPYGKTAKSKGGKYGAELTHELYELIYTTAKEIKPDCLINGSPCHPYFDEFCDQARLHDYGWSSRNETETMGLRAKLFDAVMPGVLIDTDSANFAHTRDAMRFYRAMPKLGIPDIYRFSNGEKFRLTDEDWDEIRAIFNGYADEMDRKYGKDE